LLRLSQIRESEGGGVLGGQTETEGREVAEVGGIRQETMTELDEFRRDVLDDHDAQRVGSKCFF